MIIFGDSTKLACLTCVNGHRSKDCFHSDRAAQGLVFLIEERGRPATNEFGNAIKIRAIKLFPDDHKNAQCDNSGLYTYCCPEDCCRRQRGKTNHVFLSGFVGVDYIENVGDVPNSEKTYLQEEDIKSRTDRALALNPNHPALQRKRNNSKKRKRKSSMTATIEGRIMKSHSKERKPLPGTNHKDIDKGSNQSAPKKNTFPLTNGYSQLQLQSEPPKTFTAQPNLPFSGVTNFPIESNGGPRETMDDISRRIKAECESREAEDSLDLERLLEPVIQSSSYAELLPQNNRHNLGEAINMHIDSSANYLSPLYESLLQSNTEVEDTTSSYNQPTTTFTTSDPDQVFGSSNISDESSISMTSDSSSSGTQSPTYQSPETQAISSFGYGNFLSVDNDPFLNEAPNIMFGFNYDVDNELRKYAIDDATFE